MLASLSTSGIVGPVRARSAFYALTARNKRGQIRAQILDDGTFTNNGGAAPSNLCEVFGRGSIIFEGATGSVVIGSGLSGRSNTVLIGSGSITSGNTCVVVGQGSIAYSTNGVIVGQGAVCASGATALGQGAQASGGSSTALGRLTSASQSHSIALGSGAQVSAASQLMIGSSGSPISEVCVGVGNQNSTPPEVILRPTGCNGTNNPANRFTISAGRSTGTATPGVIALQSTTVIGSGSTQQTLTDVLTITNAARITIADAVTIFCGSSVGLKIGDATTQKLGFWGVTPVTQPAGADQAAITDSTTGTATFTLVDVGAVPTQANINDNFASLNRQMDAIRTALVSSGIIKGAA